MLEGQPSSAVLEAGRPVGPPLENLGAKVNTGKPWRWVALAHAHPADRASRICQLLSIPHILDSQHMTPGRFCVLKPGMCLVITSVQ